MSMLDRVKAATSLVIHVPETVKKISVVIEQKAEAAESALKREAAALEKAMTPEFEAAFEELEAALQHIPGLADLVKKHEAAPVASVDADTTAQPVL